MPTRILYLIPTLRPHGGAEVALANLVPYMEDQDHEVWVGVLYPQEANCLKLALPAGRVIYFNFKAKYYTDIRAIRGLVNFISTHSIDILHTHLFEANMVGRLAGFFSRVPVIITTEHNVYLGRSKKLHMTDRLLAKVTTKIVAVSNAIIEFSSKQTGVNPNKYIRVPNSVPIDRIKQLTEAEKLEKRRQLGLAESTKVLLSVGRLTEQKGYPYLFDAVPEIVKENADIHFLIVGRGTIETELKQRVIALGLSNYLSFLGFREDIYDLMQLADLLVMPSLWEGLPVVLIEAGACGLPCVATDVGGVAEVVKDGVSGRVIPARDSRALVTSINQILQDPELQDRFSHQARQWIEDNFSGQSVAQSLSSLYSACLAKRC